MIPRLAALVLLLTIGAADTRAGDAEDCRSRNVERALTMTWLWRDERLGTTSPTPDVEVVFDSQPPRA